MITHDFVHKTHLRIFDTYYPPVLSDWWMDDWISHVYPADNARKVASYPAPAASARRVRPAWAMGHVTRSEGASFVVLCRREREDARQVASVVVVCRAPRARGLCHGLGHQRQ